MKKSKILIDANCEMQVVCGKSWHELAATKEDGIRFCGDCKKMVFYTTTSEELRIAAEKGLCVYIESNENSKLNDFLSNKVEQKKPSVSIGGLYISGRTTGMPIFKKRLTKNSE